MIAISVLTYDINYMYYNNNIRCQTLLLHCYNNGLHHHHSPSTHYLCLHANILFFLVICERYLPSDIKPTI